jgi:hypothetical protein
VRFNLNNKRALKMSVVMEVVSKILNAGIESEVNRLRDEANNSIGAREGARAYINENLNKLPVLVAGDMFVQYKDDRGENKTKTELKNHAFWIIALQTTIEVGHTSYDLLCQILRDWAKESQGTEWSKESAKGIAKRYIKTMQELNILSSKLDKMEYKDAEGNTREGVVVKLHSDFNAMMNTIIKKLREEAHMVCKPLRHVPLDWKSNSIGIGTNANLRLIKGRKAKGKVAAAVLAAVNKLQGVAFTMSKDMVDAAYDMLDNQHEFNSTEEELRMYREVIAMENGNFFFPVTMDTRGRMYYRGGLLSPQGTDYCKALFQFAESRELGYDGWLAIKVHLANTLGKDKVSIADRVKYIQDSHVELMNVKDHFDVRSHFPSASVFQATVAIAEYQRISNMLAVGISEPNIKSNLVCHQDGTCNGLQHMAAITKNRQTAVTVNCVESTWHDTPADVYGIMAEFAATIAEGAAKDLILKYGRDMAKNPVMITGYGAGEATIISNTAAYLKAKGEDSSLAAAIGKAYIAAINANAGAVKALTEALKSRVGQAMNKGTEKYTWVTADGFVAATEYRNIECNRVRAGVFNALVPNMHPTPLDDVKTIGAMSPNFIHSIDATHCRMVVNACNHELVTVHDSIGSHAGTYFATAQVIREQFVAVHEYDALSNLCESMAVRVPTFRGDYSAREALNSAYIFS